VAGPNQASMGPRPFGRGDAVASHVADLSQPASMGPRPFGRGDTRISAALICQAGASMGPRPFGRGDAVPPPPPACARSLQWGRGLSAAETCGPAGQSARPARFNGAAAFRPRRRLSRSQSGPCRRLQWGRGLSAAETAPSYNNKPRVCASMGPRPFGRGDEVAATP